MGSRVQGGEDAPKLRNYECALPECSYRLVDQATQPQCPHHGIPMALLLG